MHRGYYVERHGNKRLQDALNGSASRLMILGIVITQCLYPVVNGRSTYHQAPLLDLGSSGSVLVSLIQPLVALAAITILATSRRSAVSTYLMVGVLLLMMPPIVSAFLSTELLSVLSLLASMVILLAAASWRVSLTSTIRFVRLLLRLVVTASVVLPAIRPDWALVPEIYSERSFLGLESRLIGILAGPNYLAVVAAVHFSFEVFARPRGSGWRFFTCVSIVAIVWSQGRTALIFLLLVFMFLGIRQLISRGNGLRVLLFVTTIGVMLIPALLVTWSPPWLTEFTSSRSLVWEIAADGIAANPVLGGGLELFQAGYMEGTYANAHNQLLESWATFGLLGVLGALIFLWRISLSMELTPIDCGGLIESALYLVILAQLPFGTPLRLSGLSFNILALALMLAMLSADRSGRDKTHAQYARSAFEASPRR